MKSMDDDKNNTENNSENKSKNDQSTFEDKISDEKKNKGKKKKSKKNGTDAPIDTSQPEEEKALHNTFFDAIAIWNLKDEFKNEIAENIIADVETSIEYWSQMILSIIIATLGLLINATPVVIGAMLIAPILRPIQAVSFSISTGNKKLFLKGMALMIMSIFVSILVAILITWAIPLSELTQEILIRTQPTLIDLGIAFASGIIAFLSFGYKEISTSLAGVAMAASLVPPIAVVGIGLGMTQWSIGRGSRVLVMTNLIAIIFAGVIILYLFGFSPNQKRELKTTLLTTFFSIAIIIILAVPLASSLFSIIDSLHERDTINNTTETFLLKMDKRISLESFQKNENNISIKLRAPADVTFTTTDKSLLTQKLTQALEKDVAVDVSIIPYITATSSEELIDPTININRHIDIFLSTLYPNVLAVETQLLTQETQGQEKDILLAEFYTDQTINIERFQQQLTSYLVEQDITVEELIIDRKGNKPTSEEELEEGVTLTGTAMTGDTALTGNSVLTGTGN